MAAPVVGQHAETSSWVNSTSPKTVTISIVAGDIIVVGITAETASNIAFSTPTNDGTALTWTSQVAIGTSADCRINMWTATADTTRTLVITLTRTGTATTAFWGGYARTWSSSDGVGNKGSVVADTTANFSAAITTTQDNSAIDIIAGDFSAVAGARTYLTTGVGTATEKTAVDNAQYSVRTWYHADSGTLGAKTVGESAPAAQTLSIGAIEIKGSAGAPPAAPPFRPHRMLLGV